MKGKKWLAWLLATAVFMGAVAGYGETQSEEDPTAAIQRLLKDSTFYFLDETEELAPYYRMADERREAILNSPTNIVKSDTFIPGETYTGTAYYVSNNGDDKNDGLSPETAWQTFERLRDREFLKPGDAVFFERGGIYRITEEPLLMCSWVTYSAYGQGEKPVITIAQENSARAECWELWHEGENGEKIWRYYLQVADVGGLVLNDEAYARRILEWPTPNGWLALDNSERSIEYCIANNTVEYYEMKSLNKYRAIYRTVEEQLTEDLTYVSRIRLDNFKNYPFEFIDENGMRTGDLFFRCDAGNPGEIYDEIAVIAVQPSSENWYGIVDNLMCGGDSDGWVLDNLSLKYFLSNSVFSNNSSSDHVIIQNCTQEWGGNTLFIIEHGYPQYDYSVIGDGIYCVTKNATIRNNYFRQCGNACTFETDPSTLGWLGTYTAEGNLIENCGQGIRTYLREEKDTEKFDKVLIKNNIIIDSGESINNACWEQPVAIDLGTNPVQFAKHIEVCDNVLIGSTTAIFRIPDSKEVVTDIHDNVIAQSRNGALITEFQWFRSNKLIWHMMEDAK